MNTANINSWLTDLGSVWNTAKTAFSPAQAGGAPAAPMAPAGATGAPAGTVGGITTTQIAIGIAALVVVAVVLKKVL